MECGDLVVVEVGGDECLVGVVVGDMVDMCLWDVEFFQVYFIGGKIIVDCCY